MPTPASTCSAPKWSARRSASSVLPPARCDRAGPGPIRHEPSVSLARFASSYARSCNRFAERSDRSSAVGMPPGRWAPRTRSRSPCVGSRGRRSGPSARLVRKPGPGPATTRSWATILALVPGARDPARLLPPRRRRGAPPLRGLDRRRGPGPARRTRIQEHARAASPPLLDRGPLHPAAAGSPDPLSGGSHTRRLVCPQGVCPSGLGSRSEAASSRRSWSKGRDVRSRLLPVPPCPAVSRTSTIVRPPIVRRRACHVRVGATQAREPLRASDLQRLVERVALRYRIRRRTWPSATGSAAAPRPGLSWRSSRWSARSPGCPNWCAA